MPINMRLEDIILQIFREALKKGCKKMGRTRLVKLLYLVEYEYYKQERARLTTFITGKEFGEIYTLN